MNRSRISNPAAFTFVDPDRQLAAMFLRERIVKLLAEPKPDYDHVKILYTLMLKEEEDDLTRRRVELAEREFEHKVEMEQKAAAKTADKKPKLLPAAEIKHRVRVLLGKEAPREIEN